MKKLNKTAARTMTQLVAGVIEVGDSRTIDNGGAFMAVHVERIAPQLVSVAHYFIQNGDMMADPDVVFFDSGQGYWYPTQITMHATGYFRDFVEFENGQPARYARKGQADLATFCGKWMKNIKAQQGNLKPAPEAPVVEETPVGAPAPAGPMNQLDLF